jgi:hypothetical protein
MAVLLDTPARAPQQHRGFIPGHPLSNRLCNAAWGRPLRDIIGRLPLTAPTVAPNNQFHDGNQGVNAQNLSPQYWPCFVNVTSNSPCSIFGLLWISSVSSRGIAVGLGDSNNADTGINIGVGATAPNAVGNNLVGVRGGINYDASGQPIGLGLHTIGKTTDGSANEAWYVDGVRVSTTGTGASFNISSGTARFLCLQHGGTTNHSISLGVYFIMGAVWARVLREGEFARLHDDPWCFVRK